ncbi:MAG: ribosome silencing factor [Prevotellaceae bacterium]|jgi:ribosome-associated protein|nr:ribosome silencing factor [Prevotellaceae bacterium]MDY3856354.1 ribosome silencing factor [Bacteroidaceae bacterium]
MQDNKKDLLHTIVNAIQDKKGQQIVICSLEHLHNAICDDFIVCQGNTRNQVEAIAGNIGHEVYDKMQMKPFAINGEDNALWIAIDYGDVMVHVFQPQARKFYDLEHLWADAQLTCLPDLDCIAVQNTNN